MQLYDQEQGEEQRHECSLNLNNPRGASPEGVPQGKEVVGRHNDCHAADEATEIVATTGCGATFSDHATCLKWRRFDTWQAPVL